MLTTKIIHAAEPSIGKRIGAHYSHPTQVEELDMRRTTPWKGPGSDADLMATLGIPNERALAMDEIALLLSGRTASGMPVPDIPQRKPSRSLASALDLPIDAMPSSDVLRRLSDRLPSDPEKHPDAEASLIRKLFAKYGVPANRRPTHQEIELMGDGLRASGKPLKQGKFLRGLGAPSARPVAAVDYTIAGDKGFSLGWALGTAAEADVFDAIHREVVIETMGDICRQVCHSRRGNGGRAGKIPGAGAWFAFTHVTARSTGVDSGMRPTGFGRLAGDPHLHTHAVLLNRIRCDDGRIATCDLGELRDGGVKLLGALVHARTATKLRREGVEVELDETGTYAKISKIPDALRQLFCERTRRGEEVADQLDPDARGPRRTALVKSAVQGDFRAARRDDLADHAAWRKLAAPFLPLDLIDPDRSVEPAADLDRLERGAVIAADLLDRDALARRAALMAGEEIGAPLDPELAAARSLIAVGFIDISDVSSVRARALALRTEAEVSDVEERPTSQRVATAKLVQGGVDDILQAAAETWVEQRADRGPMRDGCHAVPIVVTKDQEQADQVTVKIRRLLRANRSIVGDEFAVPTSASVSGSVMLAEGDTVAFGKHINLSGGKRRGRAVTAGAPVTIVGMDETSVSLRLRDGRDQSVAWSTLHDPANGTIAIAHSYAMPYSKSAIGTRPWIVAATAGSSDVPTPRAMDHAVFSRAIEGVPDERPVDAALAEILDACGRSRDDPSGGVLASITGELRQEGGRLIRRSALRLERAEKTKALGTFQVAQVEVASTLRDIARSISSLVAGMRSQPQASRRSRPSTAKDLSEKSTRRHGEDTRAALDRCLTRLDQARPSDVAAVALAVTVPNLASMKNVVAALSIVVTRWTKRARRRPSTSANATRHVMSPARIEAVVEEHLIGAIDPSSAKMPRPSPERKSRTPTRGEIEGRRIDDAYQKEAMTREAPTPSATGRSGPEPLSHTLVGSTEPFDGASLRSKKPLLSKAAQVMETGKLAATDRSHKTSRPSKGLRPIDQIAEGSAQLGSTAEGAGAGGHSPAHDGGSGHALSTTDSSGGELKKQRVAKARRSRLSKRKDIIDVSR